MVLHNLDEYQQKKAVNMLRAYARDEYRNRRNNHARFIILPDNPLPDPTTRQVGVYDNHNILIGLITLPDANQLRCWS